MSSWFTRNFGSVGGPVADIRHELLAGWFGRNFEPRPTHEQGGIHKPDREAPERDIHGNAPDIDR
jgi:hypothetical protein